MKLYCDAALATLVLGAIFVCGRPMTSQHTAESAHLTVAFINNEEVRLPSCVVIFRDRRLWKTMEEPEQAQQFADTLDPSQNGLRWEIYNAAEELAGLHRKIAHSRPDLESLARRRWPHSLN